MTERKSASFKFGKDRRLRRRADFLRVQANGIRTSTTHFVLLVARREESKDCPDPMNAPARIGVVVTKKVGNAIVRNRVKRLCRECFRLWPDFAPAGIDLVVIAREGAGALPLKTVQDEWGKARPSLLKRCASVLRAPRTGLT